MIQSPPFIIRDYRNKPVTTTEDDRNTHRPYRCIPHDPVSDEDIGLYDLGRDILERAKQQHGPDQVFVLQIIPLDQKADIGFTPWVLVKPNTYGPNPTGAPIEVQP